MRPYLFGLSLYIHKIVWIQLVTMADFAIL